MSNHSNGCSDHICPLAGAYGKILASGEVGVDATLGRFSATDDAISWETTHSTCPGDASERETVAYELLPDERLRLVWPDGAITFDRLTGASNRAGIVAFGCFSGDSFTPHPVREL